MSEYFCLINKTSRPVTCYLYWPKINSWIVWFKTENIWKEKLELCSLCTLRGDAPPTYTKRISLWLMTCWNICWFGSARTTGLVIKSTHIYTNIKLVLKRRLPPFGNFLGWWHGTILSFCCNNQGTYHEISGLLYSTHSTGTVFRCGSKFAWLLCRKDSIVPST